jgi:hypothetical protein
MNIALSKRMILYFIILLWLVFSVGYILLDVWRDFQANEIGKSYQQGRIDTINVLILQAESSCQPIPVSSGEKQIQVINAVCPAPK